jgi:hypothetical protein
VGLKKVGIIIKAHPNTGSWSRRTGFRERSIGLPSTLTKGRPPSGKRGSRQCPVVKNTLLSIRTPLQMPLNDRFCVVGWFKFKKEPNKTQVKQNQVLQFGWVVSERGKFWYQNASWSVMVSMSLRHLTYNAKFDQIHGTMRTP